MNPDGSGSDGHEARPGVKLVTAPLGRPAPFPVDGIVREEDTFLVLSAKRIVEPPAEPLETLARRAAEAEARRPGTVEVREGAPPELLAVVHDLEREPTWREGWVERALEQAFREAEARSLRRLVLPLLGGVHGDMHPYRFLAILRGVLERVPRRAPGAICLGIPPRVDPRDGRALAWLWSEGARGRAPPPSASEAAGGP